ncbi:MAG: hypothetical protein QM493_10455 [Sulfurovum sp.]
MTDKKVLTTAQKEKELNGKRYKVILETIKKSEEKGIELNHEMQIDLHFAWKETMQSIRKDFAL